MENGVVLYDKQCRRTASLRRSKQEAEGEAVGALRKTLEALVAPQGLRIDGAKPLGGHARVGHAGLKLGSAILPTREADEGAMRKDGVDVHAVRDAATTTAELAHDPSVTGPALCARHGHAARKRA